MTEFENMADKLISKYGLEHKYVITFYALTETPDPYAWGILRFFNWAMAQPLNDEEDI